MPSFDSLPFDLQLKILSKAHQMEARTRRNWGRVRHVLEDRIPIVTTLVTKIPGIPVYKSDSCYMAPTLPNQTPTDPRHRVETPAYYYILKQDADRFGILKPGCAKQLLPPLQLLQRARELGAEFTYMEEMYAEAGMPAKWPTRPAELLRLRRGQSAQGFFTCSQGVRDMVDIPGRTARARNWPL